MIRVLVVDDHDIIRTGLEQIIAQERDLRVVAGAADGVAAIAACARHQPDVVLMDLNLPLLDGIAATRRITADHPRVKVVMLTVLDDETSVVEALRAGASGFLAKGTTAEDLVAAIRTVASGEAVLAHAATTRLLSAVRPLLGQRPATPRWPAGLTIREREVLQGVAQGLTNVELAAQLGVAASTIKTHVAQVMAKLGTRDRVHVVIHAYQHGLVDAPVDAPAADPSLPA